MNRRYNGVTAYEGMPGAGKTYSLAEVALRAQRAGRGVLCNSKSRSSAEPWFPGADECFLGYDDFCEKIDGTPWVIVWDELPLYCNARKWQEFPDGLLYELTQVRKSGLELHYSTIDWMMVDVNVRRITFWVWEHRALGLGIHRRALYPPPERRRKVKGQPERARRSEFFRIKSEVRDSYDTFAKIDARPVTEPLPDLAAVPGQAKRPGPPLAARRRPVPLHR